MGEKTIRSPVKTQPTIVILSRNYRPKVTHILSKYGPEAHKGGGDVEDKVDVNIQQLQKLEQYTAAAVHIFRAPSLSRRRAGCRQGCIVRRNGPCSLAWYAVVVGNIKNNTRIISNSQR